ncbi:MAG: RNA methyltransferase [Gemmatimonadales bacterium]|jgi:TrmH family RNA methyltransferase|nr:RNA methyltransferase [Gemmatimonadales bacterium]
MTHPLETVIRDLHRRRGRERRGLALAEGVRLVEEALAAGVSVTGAAVSPALQATARGAALQRALHDAGVPLHEVDDAGLAALADTEHPQGVVAVVAPRPWSLADVAPTAGTVLLLLDALQDPGNVGTLCRTAHALGAAAVVALPGTAELTNPKALRAGMGAFFRFPCISTGPEEFFAWATAHGVETWAADAAGTSIATAPRRAGRAPVALAVGNEGAGLGEVVRARAARDVAIPMRPGAESLNVAAAAAILLYEVLRDG